MKKQMIVGITVTACVALCAAVWPRIAEIGNLPAEPVKTAVSAEFEARPEETPSFFISVDVPTPEMGSVAESGSAKTEITAEEKTETAPPADTTSHAVLKSAPVSAEPEPGDRAVIDGKPHVWMPGFGWIVDEGVGSVGTKSATQAMNSLETMSVSWAAAKLLTVKAISISKPV